MHATVCGLWLLRRRLRKAVRVKGNSARGRHAALGPMRKQETPHYKRVPGSKKYTLTTEFEILTQQWCTVV